MDNNHLIQTLTTLTTDKNLIYVLNAANPKFAKYSNSPIEGINHKIKLLRRLSFSIPNFTNMKKRIILG
nr:transposase [Ligilactobacillus agilis]